MASCRMQLFRYQPHGQVGKKRVAPDVNQGPADIILEDDDDNEDDRGEEIIEDPVQGVELADLRGDIDDQDYRESEQHLDRPGCLDEKENPVDNTGDQDNIDQVE